MLKIRPIVEEDLPHIHQFTDREIGEGYYSRAELENIFKNSSKDNVMCSLVLEEQNDSSKKICGVRISYPPGKWQHGKGKGLYSHRWPHDLEETAYFQSLFISSDFQGQGWGGRISKESLKALEKAGAKGVVCHSWKESPNNSSTRYLKKLGFKVIGEHVEYWKEVDYHCTRCGQPPCTCTAQEMYLSLTEIF